MAIRACTLRFCTHRTHSLGRAAGSAGCTRLAIGANGAAGAAGVSARGSRQGAYDLRKLRAKQLVAKPQRTRRYHVPADAARTIAALLTVRDQVIAPLLGGIRTPRRGRAPEHWTNIDRDYETLRLAMQTLFGHLGIATKAAAAT